MGADGKIDVHLDVSTAGYAGRLEVLEGPTGRRVRSEADRARIAAESLMPGVQVAAVARKHGATRWQIYDWRRRLRQGQLALPESMAPMFAPLMVEESSAPKRTMRPPKLTPAKVEIVIDDMVIRTAVDLEHLAQVIRAVRASR
ncbi:transposase [Mesorhizobium metallidurans STM 2683]|uniref:Transposase n=1 Tax=Mesorhizobium metallidurans STM 2683 TaxID=1297569 RepID=M5EZ36_9HYPH|nr:transposase [Mesorhizobium metallidurans]CCV09442.1 transposase [Mesorhizobium metallidurans STM 2683]